MQEIDIVYRQDEYTKDGVIVRSDEIVTYSVGPRDIGGASGFAIGAFLENPPDYVPASVVQQVEEIVSGFSDKERESIRRQRRAERNRTELARIAAEQARREAEANAERRKNIWKLPDPWRAQPAEAEKPWWKFW